MGPARYIVLLIGLGWEKRFRRSRTVGQVKAKKIGQEQLGPAAWQNGGYAMTVVRRLYWAAGPGGGVGPPDWRSARG